MRPVFSRVTKYHDGENRLTEAFAALLEHTNRPRGLAWQLAMRWLSTERALGEVAPLDVGHMLDELRSRPILINVRTQARTLNDKRPDLQLRFGASNKSSTADVHIWVEIKKGIDPSENQLANYLAGLAHEGKKGTVVLLAPRTGLPYPLDLVPTNVAQRSWGATGRQIARAQRPNALTETQESVEAWLIDQFASYLREEGLMAPDSVQPEHLVTFANHLQAEEALRDICLQVSQIIAEHGFARTGVEPAGPGYHYWEAFSVSAIGLDPEPADETLPWLDWNAFASLTTSNAPGGRLFFMAGLGANLGTAIARTDSESAWLDRLEEGVSYNDKTIAFHRFADGSERMVRVAYPEEVLIGPTLEEQAESLGNWIVETFVALQQSWSLH